MSDATVSDRKRAANRDNASRSTGPRSASGKAIAAANSLRHGLFAKDLLLPGESAEDLTQLKTSIVHRLNPRDAMELQLVERVVTACWKLQRLQRHERLIYERECQTAEQDPSFNREASGLGAREPISADVIWRRNNPSLNAELERLAVTEHRLENGMNRTLRQLAVLQKQEGDEPLTLFASDIVAGETRESENWKNEATAIATLRLEARVAQAQQIRAQHTRQRAEDAAAIEELCDGEEDEEDEDANDDTLDHELARCSLPSMFQKPLADSLNWQNEAKQDPQHVSDLDLKVVD